MPAFADQLEHRAEKMRERAAAGQDHIHVLLVVMTATPHPAESSACADEDEDVHDRDQKEEKCGDQRADDAAGVFKGHKPVLKRACGKGDHQGHHHDHGGVAEEKKNPTVTGRFPPASACARYCRSRRYDPHPPRMAQAESVGSQGGSTATTCCRRGTR